MEPQAAVGPMPSDVTPEDVEWVYAVGFEGMDEEGSLYIASSPEGALDDWRQDVSRMRHDRDAYRVGIWSRLRSAVWHDADGAGWEFRHPEDLSPAVREEAENGHFGLSGVYWHRESDRLDAVYDAARSVYASAQASQAETRFDDSEHEVLCDELRDAVSDLLGVSRTVRMCDEAVQMCEDAADTGLSEDAFGLRLDGMVARALSVREGLAE